MILPINGHYRLAADEHSWAIQRPRTRKVNGESVTEWQSVKWYGSIRQALNALGELMVRTSDVETLADALAEVVNVTTTLSRTFSTSVHLISVPKREEAT